MASTNDTSGRIEMRRTPKKKNAAVTVERIAEEAKRILDEEGIDKITTVRIAKRLNISTGTLYQYFSNKESILFSLAEDRCRELSQLYSSAHRRTGDFSSVFDWFQSLLSDICALYEREPIMSRQYFVLMTLPEIRHLYTQGDEDLVHKVAQSLAQYFPDSSYEELKTTGELLVFGVHSTLMRALYLPLEERDRIRNALLLMIMSGLLVPLHRPGLCQSKQA